MTLSIRNAFTIPIIKIKIIDWKTKKENILQKMFDLQRSEDEFLQTNFDNYKKSRDHINVTEILKDELNLLQKEFNTEIRVNGSWIEKSLVNMHHEVHNHGQIGYSAVCFVEFDKNLHKPTIFIAPFTDFFTGNLLKYTPEEIEDGDLLLFPSMLNHYTSPNQSEIPRVVLSFNLEFKSSYIL